METMTVMVRKQRIGRTKGKIRKGSFLKVINTTIRMSTVNSPGSHVLSGAKSIVESVAWEPIIASCACWEKCPKSNFIVFVINLHKYSLLT